MCIFIADLEVGSLGHLNGSLFLRGIVGDELEYLWLRYVPAPDYGIEYLGSK